LVNTYPLAKRDGVPLPSGGGARGGVERNKTYFQKNRLMTRDRKNTEPQIKLTRKELFIQNLMHAFIILTLLGIFFKVLVF
jgi:hypothetical protein